MNFQKVKSLISVSTLVSLVVSIAGIFINNWKLSIIGVIFYTLLSNVFIAMVVAENAQKASLNNILQNLDLSKLIPK